MLLLLISNYSRCTSFVIFDVILKLSTKKSEQGIWNLVRCQKTWTCYSKWIRLVRGDQALSWSTLEETFWGKNDV
jgi:hypothetical protein